MGCLGGDPFPRGNLSKAEACYTKAIEAEPKSAPVLANRATLRLSLGRPDEALLDLNQAIIAEPGFALGLMTRGMLLLDRGKIDEALADFEAVIKASPELADGYLARGLVKKIRAIWNGRKRIFVRPPPLALVISPCRPILL